MDAKKLVEAITEVNELKKEIFVSKLDNLTSVDADLIELLKRVARHDDDVLAELSELKKGG